MFRYIVLFLVVFASPALANSDWAKQDFIKARIVDEGGKFGVELEPKKGWHTYYKESGDAGIPTVFDWSESKNITIDDVLYPEYKTFEEEGFVTHGYDKRTLFEVGATIEKDAEINLKISGAVCSEICVPYELKLHYYPESNQGSSGEITLEILITAFLAGLILNIMPCVLPVISLKVLSVAKQAGKELAHARINFFFTALARFRFCAFTPAEEVRGIFNLFGLLSKLFKLSNLVIDDDFFILDVQTSEHNILQAFDDRRNVIFLIY
jgi:hypothetical protein